MKKIAIFMLFFISVLYIYADQVEATNSGVANASPGDYIIRADGEKIILKQADIDYARKQLGLNVIQENNYYRKTNSNKSLLEEYSFENIVLIFFGIVLLIIILIIRKNRYRFFRGNFLYKNKTYIDQNGYRRFTDSDKLVHRYVVEKELGRKLYPGEVVHHKNRNKLDNSPGNLQVFASQEEHDKEHRESGWYY
jgi:hypothetical protein